MFYFLGYKMSLRKTMNDKSCISCKEDDHARVFCLAIVPLCLYFNPLVPIVPKVDLPLRTDKCDFWNHFKMLIIWTLLLFCLFRLHKIVKRR